MKYAIDLVTSRECAGWIFDSSGEPVTVEVRSGGRTWGTTRAALARPDVAAAFGSIANSATCGFHLAYGEDLSRQTEPIEIRGVLGKAQEILYRGHPKDRPRTGYQTFEGSVGESDSAAKLARLGLPADLTGKSVLDVGCNEGFFCREALRRGASRVVGVDIDPAVIEKARVRAPQAEFIASSWWEVPRARFDYVLFLSGLQHESEPKRFLSHLLEHLNDDGILILECGVVPDFRSRRLHRLDRPEGSVAVPTTRLLMEDYLSDFAVRDLGAVSVMPEGEAIEDCVFHGRRLQPTILLIHGPSGGGKTTLSREFAKFGIPVINADAFYSEIYSSAVPVPSEAVKFLRANFKPTDIEGFLRRAHKAHVSGPFNALILSAVSANDRLTVVEGYQFGMPEYSDDFIRQAKALGFRIQMLGVR
jgi:2-polyprenyl-3-methyl-5-hydroxy-6-metoxy-1,4-benzoquinol methylase